MEWLIASLILGVVGSVASSVVSHYNTSQTNQTNIDLANRSSDTNIQLARESYEQGTPKKQIMELQKAGYSEQQAKMLVAGSYTPAQQPLASTSPATVSPTLDPSLLNSITQSVIGPAMQFASDSYKQDNGGFAGAMVANPVTSVLSEHIHELNFSDVCTPANFAKFAHSSDAPDWAKELVNSNSWKRLNKSLLGHRAYIDWFNNNNSFYSWEQEFEYNTYRNQVEAGQIILQDLDRQIKEIEKNHEDIRTGTILEEEYQSKVQSKLMDLGFEEATLNLNSHKFLFDTENKAKLVALQKQILLDDLEKKKLVMPEYRENYIKRCVHEEAFQSCLAQYQQALLSDKMFLYEHSPQFRIASTVIGGLHDMGIQDEEMYRELYFSLSSEEREILEQHGADVDDAILETNKNIWLLVRGKQAVEATGKIISSFKDWLTPKRPKKIGSATETVKSKGRTSTVTRDIYE